MIHNRVENHPSYMITSTFNSLHASPQGFLQPSEEERNDSYISTEYTGRTEEPDQSVNTLSNDSGLITSNTYLYLENEDLNEDIPSTFFQDHNIPENVSVVLPTEKEIEPSIQYSEEKKEEIVEIKTENKEEEPIVNIIPIQEPLEIISQNTEQEIKQVNIEAPSPTRMSQYVLREKSSALLSALPVYDSHGSLHVSKELGKRDAKKIRKNQPLSNQVKNKKNKSVNRLRKLPTIQSGPSSPKVMCGRRFSQNLGDHVSKTKQLQNSNLFPIWNIKESITQSHQKQWWTKNYFNRYQSQENKPISNKHINLHEKTSEDVNVYENRIKKIVSKPPKMPNLSTGAEKKKNDSVLLTMMSPYFSTNPKMRLSGKVIKTIGDLIKASQNTRLSTKSNLRSLKKNFTPSNL
ncbi:unnamed protein product [Blepharisma stoltei]|uniref:Uncharacterized protein n=1 Tax=Blepharisma stoltei TaxID=1481888 RepID=A0AAU9J4X6_9CILI|nr:unnamed protein product [Blepharisma stoltei]